MSSPDLEPGQTPWYYKSWGILLIALIALTILAVGYVGFYMVRFYRDIQLGTIPPEIQTRLTHSHIAPPAHLKESLAYNNADDPSLGNPSAPIQIVEFADFECPYSRDESLIVR